MPLRCGTRFLQAALLAAAMGVPVHAQFGAPGANASALSKASAQLPADLSISSSDFSGSVVSGVATDSVLKLSLDDAVRRGIESNLGLRLTQQSSASADGRRLQALNPLLPNIDASGSTKVDQIDLVTFGFKPGLLANFPGVPPGTKIPELVTVDVTQAQATFNWNIFNLALLDQYRSAKVRQAATSHQSADAEQTVVLMVGNAYLQAIASAAQVDNARSLLEADRVLLNQAVEEHNAGVVANLDELRARVQYQTQQQVLISAENGFEKSKIALTRIIGLPAGQKLELTDPSPYSELEPMPLDQARALAYQTREDYLGSRDQVHAAELNRQAAKWERLPTVDANGYYGVIGLTHGSYHGNFNAAGSLNLPLFREAKFRGDKDVAKAQLEEQRAQQSDLRSQIDGELRDDLLDLESSDALVKVARSNVDLATKELEQAADRFQAGVDDNLPVVQAQATLADSQTQLINSLFRYNQAKLAFARSLGLVAQQYKQYLGR